MSLPLLRLAAAGLVLPIVLAPAAAEASSRKARTTTTTASTTTAATPTATPTATPAPAATAPANLLTGDTAALAGGTGTWAAENGTVALAGSGVLRTTTTVAGWSITKTGATAVKPGTVYTGSFSVSAPATGRQVVPYLYFSNSAGTVLDKVKGEITSDTVGSWTPVTNVVGIAPAAATSVALVSLTWGSVVGEAHLLKLPVLTSRTPVAPSVVGPLRTSGNQVYDAKGPIVLKGVNRVNLEKASTDATMTAEDLSSAARWGATMVRVPVSSAFWLSSNCHYDPNYAGVVDSVVQQITSRGMVALVDLHTNNTNGCGTVQQQPMADLTAVDFWTSAAGRYKSNPLVAFDLYNEPHDISDAVWLIGGTVTTAAGSYQAVGMQTLYNTVRATGATNLTFISGNNWANTPPPITVTGSNIVYGVHAYTCPVAVDSTCQANPTQPPASLSTWTNLGATAPIVATEFGWPAATSGTYNANVLALLKSRNWGWTAFAFDGTPNGRFTLVSTAGAGAAYQPSVAGMPVLTALAG